MRILITLTFAALALAACGSAASPAARHATAPAAPCRYRSYGALPDRACTPGALNPAVTQATIATTICTVGYTASIRPPLSVTEPEKRAAVTAYGDHFGSNLRSYEFDHLVPLEVGGAANNPKNLWPEPAATIGGHGSYDKDMIENELHAKVCSGAMTLAAAQHIFETDWRKG